MVRYSARTFTIFAFGVQTSKRKTALRVAKLVADGLLFSAQRGILVVPTTSTLFSQSQFRDPPRNLRIFHFTKQFCSRRIWSMITGMVIISHQPSRTMRRVTRKMAFSRKHNVRYPQTKWRPTNGNSKFSTGFVTYAILVKLEWKNVKFTLSGALQEEQNVLSQRNSFCKVITGC